MLVNTYHLPIKIRGKSFRPGEEITQEMEPTQLEWFLQNGMVEEMAFMPGLCTVEENDADQQEQ